MHKKLFLLGIMIAGLNATAQAANILDQIKKRGEVTMGVRESSGGLSYSLGKNTYGGFHVDVCRAVLKDIQKQLGLKELKINYQPVTSQSRIDLVKSGTIQMECGSTTNNKKRAEDVAFANTTYVEEVRVATKKASGINSIEDLNGKTVLTTTGTTSIQLLRNHRKSGKSIAFEVVYGKDHSDTFLLLENDRGDAFVMDGSVLRGAIANSRKPDAYQLVGKPLSVEPIAIMLPKNDPQFEEAVNKSLKRMMGDGTLKTMWDKWFLQPIPPRGIKIGLELSPSTLDAWKNPNNKPEEEYTQPK